MLAFQDLAISGDAATQGEVLGYKEYEDMKEQQLT